MTRGFGIGGALALVALLAACSTGPLVPQSSVTALEAGPETPRPAARPGGTSTATRIVPQGVRTADAFDTTTQAERVAALAPPARQGRDLGTTIASLGAPGEPGFWLRTPLVSAPVQGRVSHAPSGASLAVELRPSGGAQGSGSQLSLPAFRAMDLPLTSLPELRVTTD